MRRESQAWAQVGRTLVAPSQQLGGQEHVWHRPSQDQQRQPMLRVIHASCDSSQNVREWREGLGELTFYEGMRGSR